MSLANPIKLIKRNQRESRKVVREKRCLTSQSKGIREGAFDKSRSFLISIILTFNPESSTLMITLGSTFVDVICIPLSISCFLKE